MSAPARDKTTLVASIAALAAVAAFTPSLGAGFVWDDIALFVDNPNAHRLAALGSAFTSNFWDTYDPGGAQRDQQFYRPLVAVSYVVNWVAGGGAAWAFHLVNVLLHAGAVFLAVQVLRRWTGSAALALAVGLLFGLHPTRTESVVWISGRTDVLMALGLLAGVQAVHAAARASGGRRAFWIAAALLSELGALMSKEAAVFFPLLLAVDAVSELEPTLRRARWRWVAVTAVVGVGYAVLRTLVPSVRPSVRLSVSPLIGLTNVGGYIERIVWPWPQALFHWPLQVADGKVPHPLGPLVVGAVGLALGALVVVRALRASGDKTTGFLYLAGAAFLAPVLNFIPSGIGATVHDRFLYFPLLLFGAALARELRPMLTTAPSRPIALAFGGVVLIWAAIDVLRVADYRDNDSLWTHELEVDADNTFALDSLAWTRAREGRLRDARDLLARSLAPQARRYVELRRPIVTSCLHLIEFDAALTADGDERRLETLSADMDELTAGHLAKVHGIAGELLRAHAPPGALGRALDGFDGATLHGEAALLASRLGHDDTARRHLARIDQRALPHLPSPLNIVLIQARAGDFAAARTTLSELEALPQGAWQVPDRATLAALRARIASAERFAAQAKSAPDPADAARFAALGMADLGAYLRALRVLRPVCDDPNRAQSVAPLYVQLLVAAGLRQQALGVATRFLGPEQAPPTIDAIVRELPESLRDLDRPREPISP